MRSHVAEGLMGLGSIFLAFGGVIVVIAFAARQADATRNVTTMNLTAMEAIVGGAVLLGLGLFLRRGAAKTANASDR